MRRVTLLFFVLSLACVAESQTLAGCGDARVRYRPNLPELAALIHVRASAALPTVGAKEKQKTSQGTRWFLVSDADYMKAGPWSTTYYVGVAGQDRPTLELEIRDHGNTISAKWINEKLLFVEVWWGRFGATDLILDVKTGKFLYSEFGDYRELGEPCQER